ncbi:extracellular calcium-sensing receptor-like [Microcaecilia unicolor]|uniref:Extracellular calcium-sensing receptor-like n=1 Tax=Microcaecilia unicolor TaxID=1415580 RepID=A0A6P7YB49_9AMPH|nr:extracellular calcium-sensing receptor-like [Microcaecilia unicolor]
MNAKATIVLMILPPKIMLLSLIIVPQESTHFSCHLEKPKNEAFFIRGDVIIGAVTVLHAKIHHEDVTFREKPPAAICQGEDRRSTKLSVLFPAVTNPRYKDLGRSQNSKIDFLLLITELGQEQERTDCGSRHSGSSLLVRAPLGRKDEKVREWRFHIRYYRDALAMVFAIVEINQNSQLLPNVTLGFKMYDSCVSESRALQGAMSLLWEKQESRMGNNNNNLLPSLAGIVGDAMSTLSIPIARILGLYNFPQISFGSLDPVLGDKLLFPSFLRTVPNERIQDMALSHLLNHLKWTWVGILTRDDDSGELAGQYLKKQIAQNDGCVAFLEKIHFHYSQAKIAQIVDVVTKSTVTVIVVYCEEMHLKPLLEALSAQKVTDKVWICTLSFIFTPGIFSEDAWRLFNGSIGLVLHSGNMPGFTRFLSRIHPFTNQRDIFMKIFWEKVFACKWAENGSLERTRAEDMKSGRLFCTGAEELEPLITSLFELGDMSYTFQAYSAVYAFAFALQDLFTCTERVLSSAYEACMVYKLHHLHPWKVLQHLKKVHFHTPMGEEIFFDERGEIPGKFDIMNVQIFPDKMFKLEKVGRFDAQATNGKELLLNSSAIMWSKGYNQIPHSLCSEICSPGYRKVFIEGQPTCCFHCVTCSRGEITDEHDPNVCLKCPEEKWPNKNQDQCLPRQPQFLSYEETMGAALAIAAVTFCLLTLFILVIFRKYAETPVVKANNRNLSYILLMALTLCFLSTLLFIGHPVKSTCLLRQTVFGITFSITVSCMLAKTVTVIMAFKSTKPNVLRKKLGCNVTSFIVLFCPVVQVFICVIWLASSPPFPESNMKSQSDKIVIQCNEGSPLLFYSMLGYLGVLAIVSFIVAFLARKLPNSFNEGKCITFSMFVFLSVWLSFIPAYLSAEGKYIVVVEIFAILASSAGLLSCLFFPKCYIILFQSEMNTKEYIRRKHGSNNG